MENYEAYSPKIFPVTLEEVTKLQKSSKMSMTYYDQNLATVRNALFNDIMEFTLKAIPSNLKRSKHDSAMLLVFRRPTGYFAKRYNNSQWLNIV